MTISSIAVFCGSRMGVDPIFEAHTRELGNILADRKITVIYGGGNKGLMGTIANATLSNGGRVVGIIPKMLSELEHQHEGLSELTIVDSMHIRKQMIYEKCDAAIILPGGYGTLDEVFEMLTWNQLSIHDKKIFFLNSAGFYNNLIAHIRLLETEEFLYGKPEEKMAVLNEPSELIPYL